MEKFKSKRSCSVSNCLFSITRYKRYVLKSTRFICKNYESESENGELSEREFAKAPTATIPPFICFLPPSIFSYSRLFIFLYYCHRCVYMKKVFLVVCSPRLYCVRSRSACLSIRRTNFSGRFRHVIYRRMFQFSIRKESRRKNSPSDQYAIWK